MVAVVVMLATVGRVVTPDRHVAYRMSAVMVLASWGRSDVDNSLAAPVSVATEGRDWGCMLVRTDSDDSGWGALRLGGHHHGLLLVEGHIVLRGIDERLIERDETSLRWWIVMDHCCWRGWCRRLFLVGVTDTDFHA